MDIYEMREHNTILGQKCDTCGKDNRVDIGNVPIHLNFSYGSDLDGANYDFCEYKCLLDFINAELKKER
jgi:hypothetical protein